MQMQHLRGVGLGARNSDTPDDGRESDAERQAAEGGDGGDVDGGDAGGGVQAKADRGAGEGREPERVAEGVGDERGEQDARDRGWRACR